MLTEQQQKELIDRLARAELALEKIVEVASMERRLLHGPIGNLVWKFGKLAKLGLADVSDSEK